MSNIRTNLGREYPSAVRKVEAELIWCLAHRNSYLCDQTTKLPDPSNKLTYQAGISIDITPSYQKKLREPPHGSLETVRRQQHHAQRGAPSIGRNGFEKREGLCPRD